MNKITKDFEQSKKGSKKPDDNQPANQPYIISGTIEQDPNDPGKLVHKLTRHPY